MDKKAVRIIFIVVGLLYAITMLVLAAFQLVDYSFAITTIVIMCVLFSFGLSGRLPLNREKPDERTKGLELKSLSFSWLLTLYFVCALSLLDHFKVVSLSGSIVLIAILFFMVISRYCIFWIIGKTGENVQ